MNKIPDLINSPELFHDVVDADLEAGKFVWKPRDPSIWGAQINTFNTRYAGTLAFNTPNHDGYLHGPVLSAGGKIMVLAHRLVWALSTGSWPVHQIDHINGVRDDNRICNLRDVPRTTNSQNRGMGRNNTSGHVGVYINEGRWCAQIKDNGVRRTLGRFDNIEDAVRVRKLAEQRLGYHHNHGAIRDLLDTPRTIRKADLRDVLDGEA